MRFIFTCVITGVVAAAVSYFAATEAIGEPFLAKWFAGLALVSGFGAIIPAGLAVASIMARSNDGDRKAQQIADASLKQIASHAE